MGRVKGPGWRALLSTAVTMAPNLTGYLVLISPVLATQLTYPPPPKTSVRLLEPPPPLPSPRPHLRPSAPLTTNCGQVLGWPGPTLAAQSPGSGEPSAQVESPVGDLQGRQQGSPRTRAFRSGRFCEANRGVRGMPLGSAVMWLLAEAPLWAEPGSPHVVLAAGVLGQGQPTPSAYPGGPPLPPEDLTKDLVPLCHGGVGEGEGEGGS